MLGRLCVVAAAFAVFGTAAAVADAARWTQFRYGPAQTGRNPVETVLTPAAVRHLAVRWRSAIDQETLWTAPLILGKVSVMSGWPNHVSAVSTATGRMLWSFRSPVGETTSGLAASRHLVYVEPNGGPLSALGISTGCVRFRRDLGGAEGGPLLAAGLLFVPGAQGLYALDPRTGAIRWRNLAVSLGGGGMGTPAYADGMVVAGTVNGVFAFDARTGRALWSQPIKDGNPTGVAIFRGSVYSTSGRQVSRLELATGHVIWKHHLAAGSAATANPAVASGLVLYHVESDSTERLTARAASTGSLVWSAAYPHANIASNLSSSPAAANGVVYQGFTDGHLRAFRTTTGRLLKDIPLHAAIFSSPSLANGRIEVGDLSGDLVALTVHTAGSG